MSTRLWQTQAWITEDETDIAFGDPNNLTNHGDNLGICMCLCTYVCKSLVHILRIISAFNTTPLSKCYINLGIIFLLLWQKSVYLAFCSYAIYASTWACHFWLCAFPPFAFSIRNSWGFLGCCSAYQTNEESANHCQCRLVCYTALPLVRLSILRRRLPLHYISAYVKVEEDSTAELAERYWKKYVALERT